MLELALVTCNLLFKKTSIKSFFDNMIWNSAISCSVEHILTVLWKKNYNFISILITILCASKLTAQIEDLSSLYNTMRYILLYIYRTNIGYNRQIMTDKVRFHGVYHFIRLRSPFKNAYRKKRAKRHLLAKAYITWENVLSEQTYVCKVQNRE